MQFQSIAVELPWEEKGNEGGTLPRKDYPRNVLKKTVRIVESKSVVTLSLVHHHDAPCR